MQSSVDLRNRAGAGVLLLFFLFLPFTSGQDIPFAEDFSGLESFHVDVVSPFDGEKVSGSVVVIVAPAQPDAISSVSLSIARENGDSVFSESLLSSNNWSTSWDSSSVENGSYVFSVEGCSIDGCGVRELRVLVNNAPPQKNDPPVSEPSSSNNDFEIFPSNLAGAFFLYGEKETLTSSGDALSVPAGLYAAKLLLFDSFVREISSEKFLLNHADVFAAVELDSLKKSIFISGQEYAPSSSVVIRAGFEGDYTLLLHPSSKTLAACPSFDEPSSSCAGDWVILSSDEYSFPLDAGSFVAVVDASPVDSSEPSPIPPVEKAVVSLPPLADSFSIFSLDGALVESSSSDVSLLPGEYHVRVDYEKLPIRSIFLRDVKVSEDTSFLTVSNAIDFSSIPVPSGGEWLNVFAVNPFVDFSSGSISYHSTPPSDGFFYCDEWDFSASVCATSFVSVESPRESTPSPADEVVENADLSVDISSPPGLSPNAVVLPLSPGPSAFGAVSFPRSLRVEQSIDSFSANDLPFVNVFTLSGNDTPSDGLFDAFLTSPGGETFSIPSENIRKKRVGEFDVSAFRPRSFRPGLYTISVRPRGDASDVSSSDSPSSLATDAASADESISFYWGLLALNTQHSIYQPGETVEFELVVLDKDSFGVPSASVELEITSPSGSVSALSSSLGSVIETTSPGIYLARFPALEEGSHAVSARASANGIDTRIDSSFDVRSKYDFDIFRRTITKMDPAYQPVSVELSIIPRSVHASSVTVREFVPSSFEIDTDLWVTRGDELGDAVTTREPDPRVHVQVVGDTKIIEWRDVALDSSSGALLSYTYTLPPLKPWLYLLGPLEVDRSSASSASDSSVDIFTEARSWMVAVDDSNTSVFHFSDPLFYVTREPMPNDAVANDAFIGSSTQGLFAMHPSLSGLVHSRRTIPGTTSTGTYRGVLWSSPPLAAQTIAAGNWTVNLWGYESGNAADLTPIVSIWGWTDANDSRLGPIREAPVANGELGLTPPALKTYTLSGTAITLSRKDKIVVEIDLNGLTPASAAFADFNWDDTTLDMNAIFGSPIELYRQFNIPTISAPSTDNNTGIVSNENFLVQAVSSCDVNFFDCASADINLQWCAGSGCSNWVDVNASSGSIQLVSGSNPDTNTILSGASDTSSWVVKAIDTGTYEFRVTNSGAFADTNTSSGTNRTVTISPPTSSNTIVLNSPAKYSTRYAGASASDFLGRTFARSLTVIGDTNYDQNVPIYNAVQVLNMDNGAYANDLFIPAALADINSKSNAGALYVIQNADSKYGDKYLANTNDYTYVFSGSRADDLLTFAGQPTPGYYLKDTDGNGYTNDLLILASRADFGATDAGALYYIRDIDQKLAGTYDLNQSAYFSARYDGWKVSDFLGDTIDSGEGVKIGNFDGNNVDNDLFFSVPRSNTSATDSGQMSLYKDFNKFSGIRTVNTTTPSWYVYGGNTWTSDFIGGHTLGPPGFQLVDFDGNGFANDLIVLAPFGGFDDCDSSATANWGGLYVIKDISRRSTATFLDSLCGSFGSATAAHYYFYNSGAVNSFGRTGDRNFSLSMWDLNGDGVYADMLFTTPWYSSNSGTIWLQKEVFRLTTGVYSTPSFYFAGNTGDWLGFTNDSGPAAQIVNADMNTTANDLMVNCPLCDGSNFITRSNSGNVSITHDVNRINGFNTTSYRILNAGTIKLRGSRYIGSRAGDQIGDTNGSGDGLFLRDMDGDGKTTDLFISGSAVDAPYTDTGAVYWIQDVNDFSGGGEFSVQGYYMFEFDLNKDANYTARWSTSTAYDRLGDTNRSHESAPRVVNLDNGSTSNDLMMLGSYVDVNGKTDAGALYIVLNANTKSGNQDLSNSANYSVMFNGASSNEFLGWNVYGGKGYQVVNIDGNSYANDLLISAARVSDSGLLTGALYVITDADTKSGALDLNNTDNYYKKFVGGAANDFLTSTLHSGEGAQLVNLDNNSISNDLLFSGVQADVNGNSDSGAVYWLQDIYIVSGGSPPANDYSFVLLLPSSGCTLGKGNISGGTACQRLYWEPTDLSGVSDENQVNPEGQTSNVPFLVYDNQSSSSSDLNILLDINQTLPSTHIVKVSRIYTGWAYTCTGNTDSNCLTLSTSAVNAGKATYSAGTQDLNLFIWTDFNAGSIGQLDRNLDSNSVAPS